MDAIAHTTVKIENGVQERQYSTAPEQKFESFVVRNTTADEHVLPDATRRQMNFVKNQFETWYEALHVQLGKSIDELTKSELAEVLRQFYLTARKKDGSRYKLCSFQTIRRCLSLIFYHDYKLTNIDIATDPEFTNANAVYNQMIHYLRGLGENTTSLNESWQLTSEKLIKLYTEGQLDFYNTTNPKVLLQTVFFYICYYTGIGKLSVMKRIQMNDIEVVVEKENVIAYNFHLRKYLPTKTGEGPFTINEIPGKPWCPVLTIQEYLSHRNTEVSCFFQKPLSRSQCVGSNIWFKKCRFKDLFPLTIMSQEAGIDPPLSSGCFNKRRISAEIRFEMTYVYTKLFPAYFGNKNEFVSAPHPIRRKRVRKLGSNKDEPRRIVSIDLEETSTSVSGAEAGEAKATADGRPSNGGVPVATTSVMSSNAQQVCNPLMRDNIVEDYATRNPLHRSSGLNPNNVENGGLSIAVGRAYTCKQENITDDAPTMVEVGASAHSYREGPIQSEGSSTNAVNCNNPATTLPANSHNIEPNNCYEKTPLASPSARKVPAQNTSAHTAQYPTVVSMPTASHQKRGIQEVVDSISQYSGTTAGGHASYSAPSRTEANGFETSPGPKRSRFDDSSYTFLREISASAREQGKGAVMLLINLLDDLSNNKGKELLKDILQEMKIV